MAKDNDRKTTPATPATTPKPSFEGGTVPKTFDPKDLGTKFFSDMERVYNKGPVVNPIADFTDYSGDTKKLIADGINNAGVVKNQLNGVATGKVGSSNPFYLSGPDFTKGITGDVAAGKYLGKGNPFLNAEIEKTRDNVSNDVNSTFASNGRFGADIHAEGLGEGLATAENSARFNQYNTDYDNMMEALGLQTGQAADRRSQFDTEYKRKTGALDRIDEANATALGYSGLNDSKLREKKLSDQAMWDSKNNSGFNHLAKYLGLLRGGDSANETNKPLSLWDIIGGIGQTVGSFL